MLKPKVRSTRCLHCGEEFGRSGRIDRSYCGESCRVMAYRERRQRKDQANGRPVARWSETGQPLLHKTLAALADLQSQIVDLGHSLQVEEKAERQRRDAETTPLVDQEAEKDSLRKQLAEVTDRLATADKRVAELEGVVSEQRDQIRKLEQSSTQRKNVSASAVQLVLHTLASELTREEERWITELGDVIRQGYDSKSDRLIDQKFDELRAEQVLADAEERAGGVPSLSLHRQGVLLWPMAVWASVKARQEEATRQQSGLPSRRQQIRVGQQLRPTDEVYLCELSAARTRDLGRRLQAVALRTSV